MLTLAIVILSACSAALSSSTGAIILHGPHHSAQKSTRTGRSLPRTSASKLASVTVLVLAPIRSPRGSVVSVLTRPTDGFVPPRGRLGLTPPAGRRGSAQRPGP